MKRCMKFHEHGMSVDGTPCLSEREFVSVLRLKKTLANALNVLAHVDSRLKKFRGTEW